ncbi:histidine triad nucleotide-binding protein [Streptacidiphilus sp. PB12-B1b]|uniref:histidine triad nucleotide-binding protein n=1 Tax=Streptacidiphilus sp. PB12-B1b TaxID=2705012 RepID=UPI0015FB9475|nr:histidine triad nucleotide-binding protein [Streptacidiphilus sp. PB12-B1b]QMU75584.1 histidine triad nucleotide-binding protein [Streptacidiphilus sp. PB12-B1b]
MSGEPQAECLFCRIVAGEIPATVVRETDATLAFRDISPQAPTHVLVVPKAHYPDAASLAEADPALAGALLAEVGRVAESEKVAESAGGAGYRLIFNTGAGAGQTVFHAHVHVLGGGDGLRERLV